MEDANPSCSDCRVDLVGRLQEWRYGCPIDARCQAGWHHTPCEESSRHGASIGAAGHSDETMEEFVEREGLGTGDFGEVPPRQWELPR